MVFEYALAFTTLTIYTIARHFWTDIKEKKVDSRRNHMMIGAVLTLAIVSHQFFTIIVAGLVTIAIMMVLSKFEKKQNKVVFGDGDKEILNWSIPGLALVFGFPLAALFLGLLATSFFLIAYLRQTQKISPGSFPGLIIISTIYMIILVIGWGFF